MTNVAKVRKIRSAVCGSAAMTPYATPAPKPLPLHVAGRAADSQCNSSQRIGYFPSVDSLKCELRLSLGVRTSVSGFRQESRAARPAASSPTI